MGKFKDVLAFRCAFLVFLVFLPLPPSLIQQQT
jgi:hypothetical protein